MCAGQGRIAGSRGRARGAATAVVRQEGKQLVHRVEMGAVDDKAAVLTWRDQAGMGELFQMERQG